MQTPFPTKILITALKCTSVRNLHRHITYDYDTGLAAQTMGSGVPRVKFKAVLYVLKLVCHKVSSVPRIFVRNCIFARYS
jgi:hypothetical protein